MRFIFLIAFLGFATFTKSQTILNADSIGRLSASENIYSKSLFSDSLATSFCITIKKEVKLHKHAGHSEHVIVMEGEGLMKLGDNSFTIKKGDIVFIPKNTPHAVKTTSKTALKVISIQSPLFDGKDRIMIE